MPILKFPTLAFALCLVSSGLAAPIFSQAAAVRAVEKLMPSDGPKEYVVFNVSGTADQPDKLLYTMREAHEQNVCLAVFSPKLEFVRDLLTNALIAAPAEKFDGLYLLIVADAKDLAGFKELVKGRGIHVKCGIFK